MFRAFSDQLFGTSDRHAAMRADVIAHMRARRDDYEPFLVDDVTFERHISNLSQDGTFGGE